MLAGNGPTGIDAPLQDLAPGLFHHVQLIRVTAIEQDQRVQVAIAGMEDVANPQAVFFGYFIDEFKHRWNLGTRHDAVLGIERRTHTAERAESVFAALPQQRPFVSIVFGAANFARLLLQANFPHLLGFLFDDLRQARPVQSAAPPRHPADIRRGKNALDGLQRPSVQHLQRGRGYALSGDGRHSFRRVVHGLEDAQQRSHPLRTPQQLYGRSGDDAQRSFRSPRRSRPGRNRRSRRFCLRSERSRHRGARPQPR